MDLQDFWRRRAFAKIPSTRVLGLCVGVTEMCSSLKFLIFDQIS